MSIDERIERLAERQEALTESVELLRGSVTDLTAIVLAQADRERARQERDRKYLTLIADVLKSWAGNGE